MAQKLRGVGGVLGNLISPEAAPPAQPEPPALPAPEGPAAEAATPETPEPLASPPASDNPRPKTQGRVAARRGRPPGQKAGEAADKEKVTLRLNKELMDDYRDWSWEERCQVGELVEKALLQYRKHRTRQKSQ